MGEGLGKDGGGGKDSSSSESQEIRNEGNYARGDF